MSDQKKFDLLRNTLFAGPQNVKTRSRSFVADTQLTDSIRLRKYEQTDALFAYAQEWNGKPAKTHTTKEGTNTGSQPATLAGSPSVKRRGKKTPF